MTDRIAVSCRGFAVFFSSARLAPRLRSSRWTRATAAGVLVVAQLLLQPALLLDQGDQLRLVDLHQRPSVRPSIWRDRQATRTPQPHRQAGLAAVVLPTSFQHALLGFGVPGILPRLTVNSDPKLRLQGLITWLSRDGARTAGNRAWRPPSRKPSLTRAWRRPRRQNCVVGELDRGLPPFVAEAVQVDDVSIRILEPGEAADLPGARCRRGSRSACRSARTPRPCP